MSLLVNLWKTEPARVVGFITALIALLVAFGVELSSDQQSAILGIVAAVLILLGSEVTRAQVVPKTESETNAEEAYMVGLYTPTPTDL